MSTANAGGMATLAHVAAEAGVSTATAARALGDYGSVKPATRERVLEAAQRLGYRANTLARSMITGTTRTIGVVLSDIENPFFSKALRGISDVGHRNGYELMVLNTDESVDMEREAVRVLLEKRVDGLVVSPSDGTQVEHLSTALGSGTPVVQPPLSVIDQPAYELGGAAGRRLLARVADGTMRARTTLLPAEWRERGSIAPPRPAEGLVRVGVGGSR